MSVLPPTNKEHDTISDQFGTLHSQANDVSQKCGVRCNEVKLNLFKSFCNSLYTAQLLWKKKTAFVVLLKKAEMDKRQ